MKEIIFELRYCTSNGVNVLLGMLQIALITLTQYLSSDHTVTLKSFLVENIILEISNLRTFTNLTTRNQDTFFLH